MLRLTQCGNDTLRGSLALGFGKIPAAVLDAPPNGVRGSERSDGSRRPDGADAIIACSGLCVRGIVLPSGALLNRVLTRSPYYYYPELPKVLHFYMGIDERLPMDKVINAIDSYLFAFNCRFPDSTLHGKGHVEQPRDVWDDRYIAADPDVWIHDPIHAANGGRGTDGEIQITNEQLFCGNYLYDEAAKAHLNRIDPLTYSRVGVTGRVGQSQDKTPLVRAHRDDPYAEDKLRLEYEFQYQRPADDLTTYVPTLMEERWYLRHDELRKLTAEFPDFLGYYLEGTPDLLGPTDREPIVEEGWENYRRELRSLQEVVAVHALGRSAETAYRAPPVEYIHCDQEYDPVLLSYFVDGLSAARSRAAFLSFYQVLEHAAGGERGSGGDLSSLTWLLQDTDLYPDRVLSQIVSKVGNMAGGTRLADQMQTHKGKYRRDMIARLLHTETRNPLIHARIGATISRDDAESEAGTARPTAIPPFSREEHESAIEARTVLCRELARVVVARSGELRGR